MLVSEVMTSPAVTVQRETSLKRVAQLLDEHSVTALPVVEDDGTIVGVISEADVVLEALPHDPRAHDNPQPVARGPAFTCAGDVMNFHPVTVGPRTDLAEATELMTSTSVKSLPVVDGGVVVGMVSRRDVIRVLAHSDEIISAGLDDLLRSLEGDWLVEVDAGVVTAQGPDDERERDIVRAIVATVPGVVALRFG